VGNVGWPESQNFLRVDFFLCKMEGFKTNFHRIYKDSVAQFYQAGHRNALGRGCLFTRAITKE
jgi:hypothetical protein